ncbi:NUDIX domain-containing protein [Bdellovibrio sp. HCB337]|uniref:NUDIX domain-containing protein n=1 Tax=Bdellovibrio sp. HCB337 TaxID=3394358 RepID=UPI0039A7224D
MSFSNPVPVAVALVPYKNKLIGIRRGIEPRKGQVAFPGGYINSGESFNQALTRELFEETGIRVPDTSWEVFHIGDSLQSNRILIFGVCKDIPEANFDFKSDETQEVLLIEPTTALAFPLHEDARNKFHAMMAHVGKN